MLYHHQPKAYTNFKPTQPKTEALLNEIFCTQGQKSGIVYDARFAVAIFWKTTMFRNTSESLLRKFLSVQDVFFMLNFLGKGKIFQNIKEPPSNPTESYEWH